ncbi:MAG: biotin/lipoyl-binding protein [Opitutaceae bacterium]|nr:biotin/lipoyl-binding protein [Opitutaceae bacterium]
MKKIDFMLTTFRDGFQSVFGARVFSKDYLPLVEYVANECGITHFEAGGGALFQSQFFYANENAFDVMDAFRAAVGPKANLQTLARGINVVALKSQPRDIVKLHAVLFKKYGISTIRNFDALNDVHNLIDSGRFITEAGLKHEMCVTMMELPPGCSGAHEVDFYEKNLRALLDAGIPYSSICFKDASGTSRPQKVHDTIKMARSLLGKDVRIVFHSHETAGTCVAAYLAAINAGADQVDLDIAPISGGTSQPDIITMWHALRGTEYTLDVDINKIMQLGDRCKEALKDYFFPPEAMRVEPLIPFFPMPGGALTTNTQMLRDNGLMDRYPEIIAAMGEVVKKGGFGTSVTPVSQFYFQQAFNNVMFGPWKKIADGYGRMVLGYFGSTPVAPDPEVVRISAAQLKLQPTTDHLTVIEQDPKRGIAAAKDLLEKEGLATTDENIFIVASCEEKGIAFLKGNGTIGVRKNPAKSETAPAPVASSTPGSTAPVAYDIDLNGRNYHVIVDGATALVNGTSYPFGVKESAVPAAAAPATGTGTGQPVTSQLPGLVLRIDKPVGSRVKSGDPILILESMKMEITIGASHDGIVAEILVAQGALVQAGQILAIIR